MNILTGQEAVDYLKANGVPVDQRLAETGLSIEDVRVTVVDEQQIKDELRTALDGPKTVPLPEDAQTAPPIGVNPKDLVGATKPDLSLIPPAALLHEAAAMMDGAHKYGAYNWRSNPVLARVYLAAALRHTQQLLDGEDFDPTSLVHHAGHARACLAIYLDAMETGNLVDDRPLPGAAGRLIRSWSPDNKFKPEGNE